MYLPNGKSRASPIVCSLALACLYLGCTGNPFDSEKISGGRRSIRGTVKLSDGSKPEDIYVFANGFNLGTRTDAEGYFLLTLPPPASQGAPGGFTGVLQVYYYIANYYLDSSSVFVQDGSFVYDRADINKDGELLRPVNLRKFLEIRIDLEPVTIRGTVANSVRMGISMFTLDDSVSVIFPGAFEDGVTSASFREVDSDEVVVVETNRVGLVAGVKDLVTQVIYKRLMIYEIPAGRLSTGEYRVVPALKVAHERIPPDLLKSLKEIDAGSGREFLNIPYNFVGGTLEVNP